MQYFLFFFAINFMKCFAMFRKKQKKMQKIDITLARIKKK